MQRFSRPGFVVQEDSGVLTSNVRAFGSSGRRSEGPAENNSRREPKVGSPRMETPWRVEDFADLGYATNVPHNFMTIDLLSDPSSSAGAVDASLVPRHAMPAGRIPIAGLGSV